MLKFIKQALLSLTLTGLLVPGTKADVNDFEFTPSRVAENVYSIIAPSYGLPTPENKGWNSNSYFIVTGKGVLVFDTGSSETIGKGISKAIKSVTDQPVRWVVNSHSHADHWLGNAAFTKAGAEIIATARAAKTMKKYGQEDVAAFSRMTEGATGDSQLAYPGALMAHREKRELGNVAVEFIFSDGGHSPGDVLLWLPKQKVILGGDVLSSNWMPIITPHADIPNLINTLNGVAALNPKLVLPGHGEITNVKSVRRDADLLTAVWKRVKEGYRKGKEAKEILSQVRTELGPKFGSRYNDFDAQIKQHINQMYKKQA